MSSPRLPTGMVYSPRANNFRIPALSSSLTFQYREHGKSVFVGSDKARMPEPPSRDRRVIRFTGPKRRPAKPILQTQPLRSTSDLGFAPPHLSTPRQRSSGFLEEERRRRLVEASFFERESLLVRDVYEEAEEEDEGATLQPTDMRQPTSSTADLSWHAEPHQCPHCGSRRTPHTRQGSSTLSSVQHIPGEGSHPPTRGSQSKKTVGQAVRATLRMEEVKGSAAYAIPPNESSTEGKMEELAELHNKLDGWYQGIIDTDEEFRSDVLYLEMKMHELLGPSWPERKSEPDIVRTSVFCDMLGRLISSTPAITKLGTAILDELMASIYQQKGREIGKDVEPRAEGQISSYAGDHPERSPPRGAAILQLGEPYFSTVRKLQNQVADLQELVAKLRKDRISEEEEKMSKIGNLVGRIMGRLGDMTFIVWKRRAQRNQMWKQHYKQLNRKRAARWVPRVFFKWLASAEEGKRERWKRIAEMLKWERDYGPGGKLEERPGTPSSEGSRRSRLSVDVFRKRSSASSHGSTTLGDRERLLWTSAESEDLSYRTARPDDLSHRSGDKHASAADDLSFMTAWGGEARRPSAAEQHLLSPPAPAGLPLPPSPPGSRSTSVLQEAGEAGGESPALQPFKHPDPGIADGQPPRRPPLSVAI